MSTVIPFQSTLTNGRIKSEGRPRSSQFLGRRATSEEGHPTRVQGRPRSRAAAPHLADDIENGDPHDLLVVHVQYIRKISADLTSASRSPFPLWFSPSLFLSLRYNSIAIFSRSKYRTSTMASALPLPSDRVPDVAYTHDGTTDERKLESSHVSITDGSFVEGSEGVTHEELATLCHFPDSIPFAAFLVVVVELAERWTYYGEFSIAPGVVHGQFESPRLTLRLQPQSLCGEITSVLGFHLVRPPALSPPTTELTVSPVLLEVVSRPPLRSVTSIISGSTLLHSWVGGLRIVTWAGTKPFSTPLSSVCKFRPSLSKCFAWD